MGGAPRLVVVVVVALVVAAVAAACAPPSPATCDRGPCVVGAPLPTGALPNDVEVVVCGGATYALVAASSDARLDAILLDDSARPDDAPTPIDFPPGADDVGASPWDAALTGDGARGVVTLWGTGAVALIDPCAGAVRATADLRAPTPLVVDVSPPLSLSIPRDLDDDGVVEQSAPRMIPTRPQGAAFAGNRVLVAFTSVVEAATRPGDVPQVGPGVVVAFDTAGDALTRAGHVVLPWRNPQSIVIDADGAAWVSCAGAFRYDDDGAFATEDGGLVRIDPDTLAVTGTIALGTFAAGTPAIIDGTIIVGSLLRAELLFLPLDATEAQDGALVDLPGEGLDAVFTVVSFRDGLALAPQFNTDVVHVIDVPSRVVDPALFTGGVEVGTVPAIEGPQAVALVPPATATQYDAVVLLGLATRVVPLSLVEPSP